MTARRPRSVSSLAALAALAAPAWAGAFGASLDQAPNSTLTCGQGAPLSPIPELWPAIGSQACTWTHGDVSTGQGLFVPSSGVVSTVRVRVGPVTGPMQVVQLRSLYQNTASPGKPLFACCSGVAASAVFTPAPNAVTTVPVNLVVKAEPAPPPQDTQTVAALDLLGLTVLAPNVPVPMYQTPGAGGVTPYTDSFWYSGPGGNGVITGPTADIIQAGQGSGWIVALNADIGPAAGGGGGGAGGGGGGGGAAPAAPAAPATPPVTPPAVVPTLRLPAAPVAVRNNIAPLVLACGGDAACVGQVLLQNLRPAGQTAAGLDHARPRKVVFGSARVEIPAGRTRTVRVRLNRAGRALLAGRRSVGVWAAVTFTGGGAVVKRITLRR